MRVLDRSMVALAAALWWVTTVTSNTISAFVGPALGIKHAVSLDQVLARHPTIRSDRRIAAEVT